MKKYLCAASLILPTLLLLTGVTSRLNELNHAPSVRLPITGYDPIHILKGRYIRFRFEESHFENKPAYSTKDEYSLCFTPVEGEHSKATFVLTEIKSAYACPIWAKQPSFFKHSHKYFVDEKYAKPLEDLLRKNTRILNAKRIIERRKENLSSRKRHGQLRYEKLAREVPIKVSMDVSMSKGGAIRLKMLNLNGKPWMEYFALNK